jgi:hypothetical protein
MLADEPSTRHGTSATWPGNSERPGRNMFAQGANDDDDREPLVELPARPAESRSEVRLNPQIKHEPSRTPPVPLPRRGRGC